MVGTIEVEWQFDYSEIIPADDGKTVSSRKDLLSGNLADRSDCRMLDLALDGDCEEPLANVLGASDELKGVALPELLRDHIGRGQHTEPLLPENRGQRQVIELTNDFGPDVVCLKPLVERAPKRRIAAGKQYRNAIERPGKPLDARPG